MRETVDNGKRRVLGTVFVVTMVVAAWHGVHANEHASNRNLAGDLRVIGLTDEGRLVSFKARSPKRTRGYRGSDRA